MPLNPRPGARLLCPDRRAGAGAPDEPSRGPRSPVGPLLQLGGSLHSEAPYKLRTRGKHGASLSPSADSASIRTPTAEEKADPAADGPTIQLVGRTPGDLMAIFDAPPDHVGAIVRVRVEDASAQTLFGRAAGIVSPRREPGERCARTSDSTTPLPILR